MNQKVHINPPSPFDSSDTDMTLRTPDGTTFRVYSRILAVSSPFFHDMLTLPQPPDEDASKDIIDVSECSEVMHTLLSFIYPIEDPPVETLSLLRDVLVAAIKYDMRSASQTLRRLLVSPKFVVEEPFGVYAIACRHGLEEEAKIASSHTLTINVSDVPLAEELKQITAYDYFPLLHLHLTRGEEAQRLITQYGGFCRYGNCQCDQTWLTNWKNRAKEELRLRPTTDIIFSLPFLAGWPPRAGCSSCRSRLLRTPESLLALKKHIDELPSTI